ncbi:MAG: CpsD/CapB family tyrosine-protein kinase [Parvularculaceae bacterium]
MKHIEKALEKAGSAGTEAQKPSKKKLIRESVPMPAAEFDAPQPPASAQSNQYARRSVSSLPSIDCDFEGFFAKHYGDGTSSDQLRTAYGSLRTAVLQKAALKGYRKIGITSASPNAGKTVTALHLSLACARREEYDIFLTDFDLRSPSIAKYISARNFSTIAEYFRGDKAFSEFIYRTEEKALQIVLNDTRLDFSAEFLAGNKADQAIDEMMSMSDNGMYFFDLPPILGCDDTIAFLPKLDALVFVAASDETHTSHMRDAMAAIGDFPVLATVLNKHEGVVSSYQYY